VSYIHRESDGSVRASLIALRLKPGTRIGHLVRGKTVQDKERVSLLKP
jgi:hypothetical protein